MYIIMSPSVSIITLNTTCIIRSHWKSVAIDDTVSLLQIQTPSGAFANVNKFPWGMNIYLKVIIAVTIRWHSVQTSWIIIMCNSENYIGSQFSIEYGSNIFFIYKAVNFSQPPHLSSLTLISTLGVRLDPSAI